MGCPEGGFGAARLGMLCCSQLKGPGLEKGWGGVSPWICAWAGDRNEASLGASPERYGRVWTVARQGQDWLAEGLVWAVFGARSGAARTGL